jgi:hypothetical protein
MKETPKHEIEYMREIQTVRTDFPMVLQDPFASMVPIIKGFLIGGLYLTPFSRILHFTIIGSGFTTY